MTAEIQGALLAAWTELRPHPARTRQYRTQAISRDVPLDAYAALRAGDDAPCLLLRAEASPGSLFEVGGMRLSVDRDDDGSILVLSLEDADRRDLFTTVCADAIAAAGEDRDLGLVRFLERLDAWRRFLRERHAGMSREETIGLIGELLILERLVTADPALLGSWKSPEDGLQDFENAGHALEIKTGIGAATVIRISSLDQLDAAGMDRIDLVHVRLAEDPSGRTLADIIDDLQALLREDGSRRQFANGLLRRGLMPDDDVARNRPRIRERGIDTYHVDETFPALVRASVPIAVIETSYGLEARAISDHAIDTEVTLHRFTGRTGL